MHQMRLEQVSEHFGVRVADKNTFLHFQADTVLSIPKRFRRRSAPAVMDRVDEIVTPLEEEEKVDTVMMKNIPCSCTQEEIIEAINDVGFTNRYNFFYQPTRKSKTIGYAFIGFLDPRVTKEFTNAMQGYRFRNRKSSKVVSVVPARMQGIDKNMQHFKNLHVMNTRRAPEFKCSMSDTVQKTDA